MHPTLHGPPAKFFSGHMSQITANLHRWFEFTLDLSRQYPPRFALSMPGQPAPWIYIQRKEDVEYILKTNFENFEKGDTWKVTFGDLLGKGM